MTAKCPIVSKNLLEENFLPKHLQTLDGASWTTNAALCKCNECHADITKLAEYISEPIYTGHGFTYDLTSVDISEFLLRTFPEFMDRRWGGWSFHQFNNDSQSNENLIKVWFDNNGYHTMPSFLSGINNAIMKANLKLAGITNYEQYSKNSILIKQNN